jgi:hypothetical protein
VNRVPSEETAPHLPVILGVQRAPFRDAEPDTAQSGVAVVLATGSGELILHEPGHPRPLWAGRKVSLRYEVDVREHHLTFPLLVPAVDHAVAFRVTVEVRLRVDDPVALVRRGVRDAADAVALPLRYYVSRVTREFAIEQSGQVGRALHDWFGSEAHSTDLDEGVGLTVRATGFVVRLSEEAEEELRHRRGRREPTTPRYTDVGFPPESVGGTPAGIGFPLYDTEFGSVQGGSQGFPVSGVPSLDVPQPWRLVAELVDQTSPGQILPLHVQLAPGAEGAGVPLRAFLVPPGGARLTVTVHAPGLANLGPLQQDVTLTPGRESDVLLFRLKAGSPGLHTVTVRAFRDGTYLGEVRCQVSVEPGSATRDGQPRVAVLSSLAANDGEITLQVLRGDSPGTYSFQLLGSTPYAPELIRMRAGDPSGPTERIYQELRAMASRSQAGGPADAARARDRLRSLGVQLWAAAVPEEVRRQFWAEAGRVGAVTILGEHDAVPWELMYPLDGSQEGDGFLAEWLPIVRQAYGQQRVPELSLDRATFVVPPGSPAEAAQEVAALRARLGAAVLDGGVLSHGTALTSLINDGLSGLLHFACHNAFSGAGSKVEMGDGPFDPLDLAYASQARALRGTQPLVFFNACRSAGEIDWFSLHLGWAQQFLQAGAGAFVGTLWAVRSDSALEFADAFYRDLVGAGEPLGRASLRARQAIRDRDGDPTWLAYAVYGSPGTRVTTTTTTTATAQGDFA